MIQIDIEGVEGLFQTIDSMVDQVDTFGREEMPQGLTDWQIEDMRRRYPQTDMPNDKTAVTTIYPRSPLSDMPGYKAGKYKRRTVVITKPNVGGLGGAGGRTSTRPILRPELFEKLYDRMTGLIEQSLKWIPHGR